MNGLQTVPSQIKYWKLAAFKLFNGWLIVVTGGLCATGILPPKVAAVCLAVFVQGGKFIEGFLDQEVGRAKDKIKQDTEIFYPANLLNAAAATGTQPKGSP